MIHTLTHDGLRRATTSLFRLAWIAFLVGPWLVGSASFAASPAGTLAIEHARILTMDGSVIDDGTLVITDGRITAVGVGVEVPDSTERIDAGGRTITPGLIDGYSALGTSGSSRGSSRPTRLAEDSFDRYDTASMIDALRHGITAVYIAPGGTNSIGGTGAVVRLASDTTAEGSYGKTLKSVASLCVDLGSSSRSSASPSSSGSFIVINGRVYRMGGSSSSSSSGGPISRMKTFASIRKQFESAVAYRRSLEDYEEKLTEYTKQIKERAKKKAEAEKKKKEAEKKAAAAAAKSSQTATPKPPNSSGA